MAIGDYEGSEDRGQPVELYEFIYGDAGEAYRYTNAEWAVTHDGDVYEPTPVKRKKIESEGALNSKEIPIEVPIYSQVADLFRLYPPGRVVGVIIRAGHIANPDDPASYALGELFPVIWTGRVLESKRGDAEASLSCEALSSGMRRPGLRRHYQWPCPLVLYGPRCMAPKIPITGAVESTTTNRVTFPPVKQVDVYIQAQVTVVVDGVETVVPETTTVIVDEVETEEPVMVLVTKTIPWAEDRVSVNFIGGEMTWITVSGIESRGILRVEDTLIDPALPLLDIEVIDGVEVEVPIMETQTTTETQTITEIVDGEEVQVDVEVEVDVEVPVYVTTAPTVVLSGPAIGLLAGDTATAYIGCPHTFAGCGDLHANAVNYGGNPWIPTSGNPVGKNNHN